MDKLIAYIREEYTKETGKHPIIREEKGKIIFVASDCWCTSEEDREAMCGAVLNCSNTLNLNLNIIIDDMCNLIAFPETTDSTVINFTRGFLAGMCYNSSSDITCEYYVSTIEESEEDV